MQRRLTALGAVCLDAMPMMRRMWRRAVDLVGIIGLPIVALAILFFGGGSVDPCLAPMPGCEVHEGVSGLVFVPIAILWLLAVADVIRIGRRRA